MTAGFGVLYYTDCRPGQGLNGTAGFQFQAASSGLATDAMPLVQRSSLYEPPAAWMRDRRPPAEYPRSLTHTADDGTYATAAGCYLGQEANGSRQGNQFTHAVVTRDVEAYEYLRPAQLWGASWWATAPAPGTELDELPVGPECGPLDTESVRDRVRQSAGGEQRLMALLSAVERLADPQTRQTVVLVSRDPEQAACWIAAATLLVPQSSALRVGFKIFVADPQYGRHDIIALHPEWAGRWADTSGGQGLVVFDLDQGRHSDTEPTDAARFWVPRFLRADDPLDVVDAIELAGEIAQGDPASPVEWLVGAVVNAKERLTRPEQLEQVSTWLVDAREDAAESVREPLVDAVLAAGPSTDVLRNLALAIGTREWGAARATVRTGLLRAEIRDALAAGDGVAAALTLARLPRLPVYPHGPDAVAEVESALRGSRRPDQVPAQLVVASRHGIHPTSNNFRDEADRFARWWIAQAGTGRTDGLLECLGGLADPLDWVREVLRYDLRSADPAFARERITSYWWRPLVADARDLTDPLDAEVVQAAYLRLPERERADLLRRIQGEAIETGTAEPDEAAWRVLFGAWPVEAPQARAFLEGWQRRGRAPSSRVCARLVTVVDRDPGAGDDVMWLCDQLTRLGVDLPPRADKLHTAEKDVQGAINALNAGDKAWALDQIAGAISQAPPETLDRNLEDLTEALVRARDKHAPVEILRRCHRDLMRQVVDVLLDPTRGFWPHDLSRVEPFETRVLVTSFRLVLERTRLGADRQPILDRLKGRLEDIIHNLEKKELHRITKDFPGDVRRSWEAWSDELRAGRFKSLLTRRRSRDGADERTGRAGRSENRGAGHASTRKGRGPGGRGPSDG